MLNRIHLENFKACKDIEIRFSSLTLLAGLNSSGKSSVLQAICALRQSYAKDGKTDGLELSGKFVQLGKYEDVLSENSSTDLLRFAITENDRVLQWSCRGSLGESQLSFIEEPLTVPHFVIAPDFQFLHADRIAPQTMYSQASQADREKDFLGVRGEYTADFLHRASKSSVPAARSFSRSGIGLTENLLEQVAPTQRLLDQVAGWMQHLSPGASLSTDAVRGTDEVLLQFSYYGRSNDTKSNPYRPTNVGFGLTYSLPIIVACLSAPPGALLLLENPEAHLHPQGQTALGALLSRCANDGVQIVVETHSDHLLNGIRLATKRGLIDKEKTALHFFSRVVETGESFVQSPAILDNGRLSNWPLGFFDQWDRDVDSLLE